MQESGEAPSAHDELSILIRRVALRDRDAFRRLYDRTGPKLLGICHRVLKERGEAEDALQDVFIKIWHNAGRFEPGGYSPMSWLIAVARHHAIDRLRARKPAAVELDDAGDIACDMADPEQAAMTASDRGRIMECLDALPPDRAEAVIAAYVEGHSYRDLAERYRLPLNTLRTWLRRSLIALRECLET